MTEIGSVDGVKVTCVVVDDAGYDTEFLGQFGLSLLLDVRSNGVTKRMMVDTGLTSKALLHNMEILGVDPKSIDFIFLTHCHYDHTGGLGGLLEKTREGVFVVAHPDVFRLCYTLKPAMRYIGIPDGNGREVIEERGGHLMLASAPFELIPGVLSTGEIERLTSYEPLENVFILRDGELVQDPELDDISLVVNVKGQGLVILAGCSHAGIVNIMRQARRVTGVDEVIAVIGGFHLRIAGEEQLTETVAELSKAGVVCAGHCTGFKALKLISDEMGERFNLLQCGKTLEFGS